MVTKIKYGVPTQAGLKAKLGHGFFHPGTKTWFPFLKGELVYVTGEDKKYYYFNTPIGIYKVGCRTTKDRLKIISTAEYQEKYKGVPLTSMWNGNVLGTL